MSKPTLLADLCHLILDEGTVRSSDLEARFPDEFRPSAASAFGGHRAMSEALNDAVSFLLAEEFIELQASGRRVRRSAGDSSLGGPGAWLAYRSAVSDASTSSAVDAPR